MLLSLLRTRFIANEYGRFTHVACFALLLATLIAASGCAKRGAPRVPAMRDVKIGYTEEGIASWYGDPYHSRAAASGEIYDMNRLTAAHRRLPFDTMVRVESRATKESVDVRITDRGPFVDGRMVDLSREAARRIGMERAGTARVKIRVIAKPPRGELHAVQVGVFASLARAAELRDRLEGRYRDVRIYAGPAGFRVVTGIGSRTQAEEARSRLVRDGFKDSTLFRRSL
jgi:rare lipoprotein A